MIFIQLRGGQHTPEWQWEKSSTRGQQRPESISKKAGSKSPSSQFKSKKGGVSLPRNEGVNLKRNRGVKMVRNLHVLAGHQVWRPQKHRGWTQIDRSFGDCIWLKRWDKVSVEV